MDTGQDGQGASWTGILGSPDWGGVSVTPQKKPRSGEGTAAAGWGHPGTGCHLAPVSLCPQGSPCPFPMAVGCGTSSCCPSATPISHSRAHSPTQEPLPTPARPRFPIPTPVTHPGRWHLIPAPPGCPPALPPAVIWGGRGSPGLSSSSAAPPIPGALPGRCIPARRDGRAHGDAQQPGHSPGGPRRTPPTPAPGGRAAEGRPRRRSGRGQGRGGDGSAPWPGLGGAQPPLAAPPPRQPELGARQKPAGARRSRRARSAQRSPAGMREAASGSGGAHPHPFPFASSPAGFGDLGST